MVQVSRGGAARSARLAHNQEVVGSNPTPATKETVPLLWGFFLGYAVEYSLRPQRSEVRGASGAPQGNVTDELCSSA